MSAFGRLDEVAPLQLFPGFLARAIHGEELTLAVVEIDPDADLPEHHHANEQFGLVISGSLHFRVGDEEQELEAGDHLILIGLVEAGSAPDPARVPILYFRRSYGSTPTAAS